MKSKRKKADDKFTSVKQELAAACNISRVTLDKYLLEPTFPPADAARGWNKSDCIKWVLSNTEKSAIAAGLDSDMADLKKWDIYERARKQKIANDLKEKVLMPSAEYENTVREAFRETSKELYLLPDRAPELTGQPASEIAKRLRLMIDGALEHLKSLATKTDAKALDQPD